MGESSSVSRKLEVCDRVYCDSVGKRKFVHIWARVSVYMSVYIIGGVYG